MLSKHPLEVLKERKLTKNELAEALRLAMIAELDAINLYLQIAERIEDERYRRVFEDIAREEKTHVGEFLALLKTIDEEQVRELSAGVREVEELVGLKVPNGPTRPEGDPVDTGPLAEEEWKELNRAVGEILEVGRIYRKHLPVAHVGKGVPAVPIGTGVPGLVSLTEFSSKFRISQQDLDTSRRIKTAVYLGPAQSSAYEITKMENEYLTKCLEASGGISIQMGDWGIPGRAVEDVSKAVSELLKAGNVPPFILFVSPLRYSKLVAVHERTGVMELTRVKALVKDVVPVREIPDNISLLIASNPSVLDVVVGIDWEIDFIGPENGAYVYRLRETLATRIKNKQGIVVLKEPTQ